MAMATQRRRTGRQTKVRSVAPVEPWIERPVVTAPVPAPVATYRVLVHGRSPRRSTSTMPAQKI